MVHLVRYLRKTVGDFDLWQFGCGRVASHGKCRVAVVLAGGPIESAAATVVRSAQWRCLRLTLKAVARGWREEQVVARNGSIVAHPSVRRRVEFATAIGFLSRLGRGLDYRWSSYQGRMGDVLASEDVEGRGRLRKAWGSCQTSVDPKIPEQVFAEYIGKHRQPGELKHLSNRWKRKKTRFPQ